MANKIYYSKTGLIGGAGKDLDSISGAGLVDGDFANVVVGAPPNSVHYLYKYDADSALAESSPDIIKPDAGTTDGRWILLTIIGADGWTRTAGTFTATPASTSTLTMTTDLTASIKVGMPLKYTIGGTTYYGRVSAIAANLLTVNGAPLSGDVTALYYGGGTVRQVVVIIPGTYEDASNTALITSDLKSNLLWHLPLSYLVYFSVYSNTHDSGATHGQASVRINATEVNTTAGGELIAADATWYPTAVNIAVAAYDINPGELLEVTSVKGSTGDASDLTVEMIFVTP